MATEMTVAKVLKEAIRKEIAAWLLYSDLGRRLEQAAAREAFKKLAGEEKEHQKLLEQCQRGEIEVGALGSSQPVDYKIAEHLEQPKIYPEMELKDIFSLAAQREKASHELYLGLAEMHPPGEVRELLEKLAAQELEHKRQVELLYTEVAYPQTDGG
jgi:rubrerythrin